jgi:hypothetical protein
MCHSRNRSLKPAKMKGYSHVKELLITLERDRHAQQNVNPAASFSSAFCSTTLKAKVS